MNLARLPLALALLAPAGLAAADVGAVPYRPFAEVRKDLSDLKSAESTPAPGTGLDLGVATGIGSVPQFAAPPVAPPAPPKADPSVATQRPASSGWLLDALEENSRRTATAGPGFQSSKADKADAADERKSDPRTGPAAAPGKDPAAAGLDRNGTKNALSAYMSVWLSPEEYRRLQSLYPEQTVGTPEGKEPGAALDPMLRLDRPMTPATTTDALLGGFGDQNRAAKANPFVQSLQAPPRPTPVSVAPVESVRIATPATATQAPVEPAPVRTATPAVPAAPGADDRKYFPQLKRF